MGINLVKVHIKYLDFKVDVVSQFFPMGLHASDGFTCKIWVSNLFWFTDTISMGDKPF
jgi:hypothetical protein